MNLDMLSCNSPVKTSADSMRTSVARKPMHRARSAFDLWQDHARKSFEEMHNSPAGEPDTVHLFQARRVRPSHQFARRLSQGWVVSR